jgi:hypothetical protein
LALQGDFFLLKLRLQLLVHFSAMDGVDLLAVEACLWDNQVEDGDIISLYLNDKKVVSNIRLTKKPQEFLIKMDTKEAYLTVFAEDFGLAEPNTSAISIKDGVNEQTMILKAGKGFQESVKVVRE